MVDLVGDDQRARSRASAAMAAIRSRREHGPGRIGRRVDEDRAGARAEPLPRSASGRYWNPSLLGDVHADRHALGVPDEVRIAGVVGVGQHDLVAPGSSRWPKSSSIAGEVPGVTRICSGETFTPYVRAVVLGDRLAQRQDAEACRVPGAAVLDAPSRLPRRSRAACRSPARRTRGGRRRRPGARAPGPARRPRPPGMARSPERAAGGRHRRRDPEPRQHDLHAASRARLPSTPHLAARLVASSSPGPPRSAIPRARASSSSSTSKREAPVSQARRTVSAAAAAVNALKPHCESSTSAQPERARPAS